MTARRILITGSTGNLGAKAVACLAREPDVDIVRMGRNSGVDPGVITARVETYDAAWARHFDGVDAVLHLAADPRPADDWTSVCLLNIDLALNVFRAAEENRVRRFVFASSNWVLGGYRFRSDRLDATLPPLPVNPYGASKLFIERYGLSVAERTGMAFLALRSAIASRAKIAPARIWPSAAGDSRCGSAITTGNRRSSSRPSRPSKAPQSSTSFPATMACGGTSARREPLLVTSRCRLQTGPRLKRLYEGTRSSLSGKSCASGRAHSAIWRALVKDARMKYLSSSRCAPSCACLNKGPEALFWDAHPTPGVALLPVLWASSADSNPLAPERRIASLPALAALATDAHGIHEFTAAFRRALGYPEELA